MGSRGDTWAMLADVQLAAFASATATTRTSFPADHRLDADALREFLSATPHAVIATSRPDGRAHAAVSSFTCYDGAFWLPAGHRTVRVRNVTAEPWAALVISGSALVTAEGPAALVLSPPHGVLEAYGRDDVSWVDVWIRVDPQALFSYAGRYH